MNGEDWQSDQGSGVSKDDNVVRLTDWLGPREEFVPFGSRADAADQAGAASVPTAEDFWSETSAAVQDPLTAPQHAPARAHLARASAAAMWGRRRARLAGSRLPRTTDRHSWPLAAISVLATAALAAVFAAGLGSGAHTRGRLADLGTAGQSAATPRTGTASFGAQVHHLRAARPVAHRASRSGSAVKRSGVHRVRHHGRAASSAATGQPVAYTKPTAATSTPAQSAPTSNATTSTTAASTAGSQAHSSGSQPALGANGSLAPGSSPDG